MLRKIVYSLSLLTCLFYVGKKLFVCSDEDHVLSLNISEIIRSYNFKAEEHYLTTGDGYTVLVERVHSTVTKETPIVLVHGMFMNAVGFINNGEKSLGLILANLGYDVWLLNYRGTKYSRRHLNLTTEDKKYWKFSINNLGIYDVRSTLKYVNDVTKKKPIYMGYSMGTTGFFIYSTAYPSESQQFVKGMIALSPATNIKNATSLFVKIRPIWPFLKFLVYQLFSGEVPPITRNIFGPFTCFKTGLYANQYVLNQIFGDDYDQMDFAYLPRFITQTPDSTGAELYSHYMQMNKAVAFQNYDYGIEKNMEVYGNEKPPVYNLSKISLPVALFASKNDWLATIENAEQIYSELSPASRCGYHVVNFEKWNHIDFLNAKDVVPYLYQHVIKKIEEIDSGICSP